MKTAQDHIDGITDLIIEHVLNLSTINTAQEYVFITTQIEMLRGLRALLRAEQGDCRENHTISSSDSYDHTRRL